MATGPQRARLDRALTGADPGDIGRHAGEWEYCQFILQQIGSALVNASPEVKERIGGKTGPAVDAAFTRSAGAMRVKSEQLGDGAQALRNAGDAITAAKAEQASLQAHPLSEPAPYQKPTGQPTPEDIQAEAQNRKAHADYQAAFADQEERARKQADAMDRVFGHSTATMKKIHGEPDPPPKPVNGGGSGGSAGAGGSGGSGSRGGGSGSHWQTPSDSTWHPNQPQHHDQSNSDPGLDYVPGDPGANPGSGSGGAPQGGGPYDPPAVPAAGGTPGGSLGVPATGGGLTAGTGLGLAGAAAGGAAGGLLGTGLTAGGIRGGVTPIAANPGTAASGVRGIGATSRTGVSGGALGRSGGAAASSGASGRAGSASAAGRRGTTGGSRGAAGGRGTGSVASGRGGRGKDDRKGRKRDLFDTEDEWVEDEDAAPGVLD